MNKYLKSWGNYEVLWSIEGFVIFIIIYLLALYGILRCAAMILYANLEFLLYCFIPTIASLFWCIFVYIYIYIYIYIYSTSLLYAAFISFSEVLSCVCYSACFHTISLYALFSEPCLPFHYSSPTEDPVVYCLPIVWRGPRSPRHTTEVLTTSLLQFFLLIIHFVFRFIFIRIFYLDKYSAHQNC